MKFPLRLLLVAWLCLTLPVQGLAGATTLICAHSQRGDAVVALGDGAGEAGSTHADAGIEVPPGSFATGDARCSGTIRCNACVACCSDAMMSAPNPKTLALSEGFAFIALPPPTLSSAVPETLDRPPR